jgi:hypothetical protein
MTSWVKNQPVAALRRATILIYEDDGVTPAPMATDFTGCTTIREGNNAYVSAAGSLINVGIDGEWYYEATQPETNVDATEVVIKVDKVGFATARAIAAIDFSSTTWVKNQTVASLRRATVFVYEDDGVTPAPMATDFTGCVTIREGNNAYTGAVGSFVNVGVDGEWYYEATQTETNVDATEVVVRVVKAAFATARAIASIALTGGPTPAVVVPPLPPGFGTSPSTPVLQHDADVFVVIPTAINVCLMASENISDNLRAQQPSDLALLSMYKRAYLIAYETDEIALVRQ